MLLLIQKTVTASHISSFVYVMRSGTATAHGGPAAHFDVGFSDVLPLGARRAKAKRRSVALRGLSSLLTGCCARRWMPLCALAYSSSRWAIVSLRA
jgi:hypothetical protein